MSNIIIPSSEEDRKKLKAMLVEMTHAYTRKDAEADLAKEIADEASKQFELPKTMVNKLAKTMYKRNYESLQAEQEDFELLYETLTTAHKATE